VNPLYLALAALVLPNVAHSATIDAADRGWFSDAGWRMAGYTNTFTGQSTNGVFRSFFLFDVSSVANTVTSAEVRLELEAYVGPDPSETFDVFDVSTTAAELGIDYPHGSPIGQSIYSDLGSGSIYGGATVTPADVDSILVLPLSDQAVVDINSAMSGSDEFAIGLRLREPFTLPSGDEGIRFGWDGQVKTHQLVLEVVPEPSTALLLASGLAGLAAAGRRRSH
jgi:hypothetical protein